MTIATAASALGGGPDAPREAVETTLAGFARALRAAGLPVTQDRTQSFLVAASRVGMGDPSGVYWAGRATLTAEPDHFPLYDQVFESWFGGKVPRLAQRQSAPPRPVPGMVPEDDVSGRSGDPQEQEPDVVRARASGAEVLRHRDIGALSPSEKAALAELFATIRPEPPSRRAVRRRPHHRGELDVRRTLRDELRRGGEPGLIARRRRAVRPRRVVLLLDVSGSMSPYADALLRLAHVWVRSAPRSTEAFTIGTRLTRVTRPLRSRDADEALRGAGEAVADWSGGTRLGEVLQAFLDRWGQRGMARGAVVVLFSDGWERGDPTALGEQMQRLHRLAHRVVWVNPHRGKAGYRPVQGGVAAALPYVDDFVAGHSLAAFAQVVEVVGRA